MFLMLASHSTSAALAAWWHPVEWHPLNGWPADCHVLATFCHVFAMDPKFLAASQGRAPSPFKEHMGIIPSRNV